MKRKGADSDSVTSPKKQRVNKLNGIIKSFSTTTNAKSSNGLSECFHTILTSLYVSLAPIHVQDPSAGIKTQHLDPLIMTYFPQAGGVVLAYDKLKLYGQDGEAASMGLDIQRAEDEEESPIVAKIMYDSPFAYMWITVELLIWRPMPGDVLEGWINLQSPSHIGLLVHDTFNTSIKKDMIPENWTFVPNQVDEEISENDQGIANDEDDEINGRIPNNNKQQNAFKGLVRWAIGWTSQGRG